MKEPTSSKVTLVPSGSRLVVLALKTADAAAARADEALTCDVDTYEQVGAHLELQSDLADYHVSFGILTRGTAEVHERMRAAATGLGLDPGRTLIVLGALEAGQLHVGCCGDPPCTAKDAAIALADCAMTLRSRQRIVFAIRVERDLLCTAGPEPDMP